MSSPAARVDRQLTELALKSVCGTSGSAFTDSIHTSDLGVAPKRHIREADELEVRPSGPLAWTAGAWDWSGTPNECMLGTRRPGGGSGNEALRDDFRKW